MTVATKHVAVIVNPRSGPDGKPAVHKKACSILSSAGVDSVCGFLENSRSAADLAREYVQQGFHTVVACGGDGTVSSVASALAGTGVALGILPAGTLNHFAKDLNIPLDIEEAARVISSGKTAQVDIGEVNGRTFINNSSLGVYPKIVVEREQRRRFGLNKWIALGAATLAVLKRWPFIDVRIEANGKSVVHRSSVVFVGNNEYGLQGLNIGRRTLLDAGRLSVYLETSASRIGLVWIAVAALFGYVDKTPRLQSFTTPALRIDSHHRVVRLSLDGEVVEAENPLQYRSRPGALKVIVP